MVSSGLRRLARGVFVGFAALTAGGMIAGGLRAAEPAVKPTALEAGSSAVRYRTVMVDGVEVFYRDAGPADAPAVLLLHGFPTSSHMYRDLIRDLSDEYRVVAPDYPGFGHSAAPDRKAFAYTFDNLSRVVERFTEEVGLKTYALYVMDYGAPVGFRLAERRPERVTALVVQNGNAYEEGLREFWEPLRKYWADPTAANRDALRHALTPEATRWQYTHGARDPHRVSPDNWTIDQRLLDRPGNAEIQLDLFYDYRTNVALYPRWHAYFRKHRPATLVVWGKNDPIFPAEGAAPYRRDLPDAEVHLLDTGHFALEEEGPRIAALMRDFLARKVDRAAAPRR